VSSPLDGHRPRGIFGKYLIPMLVVWVGYGLTFLSGLEPLRLIHLSSLVSNGLTVVGAMIGVIVLDPGDYLRRAWIANVVAYSIFFTAALMRLPNLPEWIVWVRVGLVIVGNGFSVTAVVLFARVYRQTGLPEPRAPWVWVATTVFAFASAGIPVYENVRALVVGTGSPLSVMGIASSIGDALVLVLVAPLVITAFALRGGKLAQLFWYLGASAAAWLLVDAQDTVVFFLHPDDHTHTMLLVAIEPFRQAACALLFAAALTQRELAEV
jgi:hypothetical protein